MVVLAAINALLMLLRSYRGKDGSPYPAELEHIEFVIGDGSHKSPMNSNAHQSALASWMAMHPCIPWSIKAVG
jgi:hypothetical protein